MLIFPLKKEWYEKIKSGEKTVEYREKKWYWTRRLMTSAYCCMEAGLRRHYQFLESIEDSRSLYYEWKAYLEDTNVSIPCCFQLGYKPETRLEAIITKIEIVDGKDTDLHINKPVYAIHFELVKEQ